MKILKVKAEGIATSFRYPHFMWQKHPTYEMPPPATIYGHICSALGIWVSPRNLKFAYYFSFESKFEDLEHIWTWDNKRKRETIKPFRRELLFHPKLTLYINRPEWIEAFRSPCYAVVLGRSQDLFTYTSVEIIELEQAERAYFEHTLLPHDMALQIGRGITVTMPRFLDYHRNRAPTWQRYVIHNRGRVILPDEASLRFSHIEYGPYWIDPTTPEVKGAHRGLHFLSFVDEEAGA